MLRAVWRRLDKIDTAALGAILGVGLSEPIRFASKGQIEHAIAATALSVVWVLILAVLYAWLNGPAETPEERILND